MNRTTYTANHLLGTLTYVIDHVMPQAMRGKTRKAEMERHIEHLQATKRLIEAAKCDHKNAKHDSGGAFCPDCMATGTFPGMG